MEKSLMTSKLRSVISLVDKLRDIQLQSYIKLPKIVAVGSQSSGKSSLVEQIVGLDFLPRGSGVVTRRPLEIRMVYQKQLKQPYGKFAELPDQKFTDFSKIKDSIELLTDKICGKNKNIVDKPIILDVYSAHCPNLTIIDLPGLTRIAIEGQDKDIHKITANMIQKYMMEPSTIILCVIPANQDITNDEVLYMARKIDPEGSRTIGCITKIDIMDRGTDARQTLLNKGQVQLKLGFVGIKNRSQADINEKKTVQESIENQKMYFSKSPIYSSLPVSAVGTTSLVNTLTTVLTESIIQFLPDLVSKIKERKAELASVVKQYGKPLPKSPMEKQALIWSMCNQFMNEYRKCIQGQIGGLKCSDKLMKTSANLIENLCDTLEQQINFKPAQNISDEKIMFALKKFDSGSNLPGFPSISSFLFLLNPLIQKLKFPLEQTLNNVYECLIHIADLIITQIAHDYIQFKEHINEAIGSILHKHKKQSLAYLSDVMEAQINYIYTNNPMFDRMIEAQTPKSEMTVFAKQNPMILVLRKRVDAYYKVIVTALRDLIPKNIKYMLMHQATKKIEFQLFQNAAQGGDKVDRFLKIDEASKSQRIKHQQQYDIICKAEQFLLTHSGLASFRQAETKKRLILRQKQMDEANKKKKEKEEQKKEIKQKMKEKTTNEDGKKIIPQSKSQNNGNKLPPPSEEEANKQSFFNNFFGTAKAAPPKQQPKISPPKQQPKPSPAKVSAQSSSKTSFADIFGTDPKKKNEPPMPVIKQQKIKKNEGFTQTYNREVGKATDNAVDNMYANEKFQEKSKQAVADGTSMAVQKKFGVSEDTGKTVGKGAAWLFGQDATQNYLKEETKKNIRSQTMVPPKKQ